MLNEVNLLRNRSNLGGEELFGGETIKARYDSQSGWGAGSRDRGNKS